MLTLRNIKKSYAKGKVPAVNDLNLTVKKGEIFGFIGPNGAGKTTTIKIITGILTPDQGSVEINGCDMAQDPIKCKSMIGFTPDNPEVYERLSGLEYLNFMADMYKVPAEQRKKTIKKYLAFFDLEKAAGDSIKSYSRGMRQKLVLTGALISNPPLWVLDEPMVGLDPKSALSLKEEMRAHCAAGNTVFFSTHVLEVAEKLCDRIGIIDGGRLLAVGTLAELQSGDRAQSLESIFFKLTRTEEG